MENMVIAARVGAPKGLKGEVSLHIRTDRVDEVFAVGAQVHSTCADFPVLTVERLTWGKDKALVFFEEVRTRNDSETLRGADIIVPAEVEDDAWYSHQLEGLAAISSSGERLGTVKKLDFGSAQDRLIVDTESGEVMVPFVEEIVPEVDLGNGTITVDPPEGLFE
ncbi:ribosome maturation factor RimM [Actinomycetaceae bacterium WB03_NA08]|uniref:Ribosome maturation factor RimM n=1 Tax=Scrofimicrobium canadense TaxID=2652290 RepID=A0A6N7W7F8_9ACTO|nr:ribosome maturation factor RimM [Scrofimicrobium canadense]MSS85185.1 ribosome maturation factor RimM [Scrofimicrobium canadense]